MMWPSIGEVVDFWAGGFTRPLFGVLPSNPSHWTFCDLVSPSCLPQNRQDSRGWRTANGPSRISYLSGADAVFVVDSKQKPLRSSESSSSGPEFVAEFYRF